MVSPGEEIGKERKNIKKNPPAALEAPIREALSYPTYSELRNVGIAFIFAFDESTLDH